MWRPDNWKNPFNVSVGGGNERDVQMLVEKLSARASSFEAGADAILESLQKQGKHIDSGEIVKESHPITKNLTWVNSAGWLIFIPDEKE